MFPQARPSYDSHQFRSGSITSAAEFTTEPTVDSKKSSGSHTPDLGTVFTPFIGAIPIVGTPMKAAIGGLLGILTVVDVSVKYIRQHITHAGTQKISQNEQVIKTSTSALRLLLNEIGTLPEAWSPRSLQLQHNMILYLIGVFPRQNLTNAVSRKLRHTSNELEKLKTMRKVRYLTVLQILSQCTHDVMRYLTAASSVCQAFIHSAYIKCSLAVYSYRIHSRI